MGNVAVTRERVERYLMEWFGRIEVDKQGFTFPFESTRLFVPFRSSVMSRRW